MSAPVGPVLRQRLRAQLLSGPPAPDALAVVDRLLAVQAQDPRGARLSVRSRSRVAHATEVDRALTEDRSLVVDTLARGTLHLVLAEDLGWLHALLTPPLHVGNARRLRQEGVDEAAAERGVAAVVRALASGPLLRAQLREVVRGADVPVAGQALVHVLMLAGLRGLVVRGPVVGREQAWVLRGDWLPAAPPVDRDLALVRLAERYLAGHGPADDRDLARWSGLPLGDVRRGLAGVRGLRERPDGLLEAPGAPQDVPPVPGPRLLGPFEPLLLGWASRDEVVGGHVGLVTVNGLFRAFALVDGRAAGTWSAAGGRVVLTPFAPLPPVTTEALEADGERVLAFLGG